MNTHRTEKMLLACIMLLAACTRFPYLDQIPPGLYSDEASAAYDAYSIMRTGRDHYGVLLPLYCRGFDFWWAALIYYLAIPPIALGGLNVFTARFSVALLGLLTVWLTYLLLKDRLNPVAALWAAFLLAISPWHIHNSRYLNDVAPFTFFFVIGLLFFARGLDRRNCYFHLSAVSFALCFYTYIVSRIFIPLACIGVLFIYRKELAPHRRSIIRSLALFFLLLIPTFSFAIREPDHFFTRYNQISLMSGGRSFLQASLLFMKNYALHLSPVFLFFKGDANWRNFPQGFGQLYPFEIPLIVIGIISCIRAWRNPDARFLIFWLLIYGIPASLTVEDIPHGLRASTAIPLYEILSAIGICWAWGRLRSLAGWRRRVGLLVGCLLAACAATNVYTFFHHYIYRYPVYAAHSWDYGWREAMDYANSVDRNYDHVVLTVLSVGAPTMHPPFHLRYDPAEYQRSRLEKSKYLFATPEVMPRLFAALKGRTLYLVREQELAGAAPLKIVRFPDGRIAFKIIEKIN